MSVRCKYSDVKAIYDWYDKYADDKMASLCGTQPSCHIVAYYTPSQANWSYQIGLVMVDEMVYEVVLVFGQVKAVRLANIPHYTMGELKTRSF